MAGEAAKVATGAIIAAGVVTEAAGVVIDVAGVVTGADFAVVAVLSAADSTAVAEASTAVVSMGADSMGAGVAERRCAERENGCRMGSRFLVSSICFCNLRLSPSA